MYRSKTWVLLLRWLIPWRGAYAANFCGQYCNNIGGNIYHILATHIDQMLVRCGKSTMCRNAAANHTANINKLLILSVRKTAFGVMVKLTFTAMVGRVIRNKYHYIIVTITAV